MSKKGAKINAEQCSAGILASSSGVLEQKTEHPI